MKFQKSTISLVIYTSYKQGYWDIANSNRCT